MVFFGNLKLPFGVMALDGLPMVTGSYRSLRTMLRGAGNQNFFIVEKIIAADDIISLIQCKLWQQHFTSVH